MNILFQDSGNDRPKILIVDDNNTDTLILSERVHSLYPDHGVLSAGSVREAHKLLQNYSFSLVLLDLNLPDGFGPQTVKEIRQVVPKTPIIVVTGMVTNITVNEALKLGANNVVSKFGIPDEDFQNILDQNLNR